MRIKDILSFYKKIIMIENIKYYFDKTLDTSYWYEVPYINIDHNSIKNYDENIMINEELNQLSWEYVREIVRELEEVVAWTRDYCSFWFETTFVNVWKKGFKSPIDWKIYDNWFVDISYNYWEDEIDTDLKAEEILKMMTEWRDYINAWEKETGKIKH